MEADTNPIRVLPVGPYTKYVRYRHTNEMHVIHECDCVWVHNGERNSHVTSEPAEVIVGVLTLNPTVEVLEVYLCSLDTQKDTHTR